MTEWTLTKKSVAGMGMFVIGDNEGVFARRSTLVFPTMRHETLDHYQYASGFDYIRYEGKVHLNSAASRICTSEALCTTDAAGVQSRLQPSSVTEFRLQPNRRV